MKGVGQLTIGQLTSHHSVVGCRPKPMLLSFDLPSHANLRSHLLALSGQAGMLDPFCFISTK
jgi:hypothetical protein